MLTLGFGSSDERLPIQGCWRDPSFYSFMFSIFFSTFGFLASPPFFQTLAPSTRAHQTHLDLHSDALLLHHLLHPLPGPCASSVVLPAGDTPVAGDELMRGGRSGAISSFSHSLPSSSLSDNSRLTGDGVCVCAAQIFAGLAADSFGPVNMFTLSLFIGGSVGIIALLCSPPL